MGLREWERERERERGSMHGIKTRSQEIVFFGPMGITPCSLCSLSCSLSLPRYALSPAHLARSHRNFQNKPNMLIARSVGTTKLWNMKRANQHNADEDFEVDMQIE